MNFADFEQSYKKFCTDLSRFDSGRQVADIAQQIIPVGTEGGFLHRETNERPGAPTTIDFIVFDDANLIECTSLFANDMKDLEKSFVKFEIHPMQNRRTKSIKFSTYKLVGGDARFMQVIYTFEFQDGFELVLDTQNDFLQSRQELETAIKFLTGI